MNNKYSPPRDRRASQRTFPLSPTSTAYGALPHRSCTTYLGVLFIKETTEVIGSTRSEDDVNMRAIVWGVKVINHKKAEDGYG